MITVTLPGWMVWLLLAISMLYAFSATLEAIAARRVREILETDMVMTRLMFERMKEAMEQQRQEIEDEE